ncbi:hypothetical protein [Ralstonia soli]|uniref:Uncharacterized protein n=1 Tax=Ralstonia soli TaxID=2953896 RepID=A0ABT1AE95_9RALS|nr:hypothetical protein [Ralstonia soli]MCO5396661.1 hypothetical protein [Ralstonia soli]
MQVHRFLFAANSREVIRVTQGNVALLIPTEVPPQAIEQFHRRLRDQFARPLAWKRRVARETLRCRAKQFHGLVRIKRRPKVRGALDARVVSSTNASATI